MLGPQKKKSIAHKSYELSWWFWMNEWGIYISLYCVFLYTQSTLQLYEGISPQQPPECSIHLDDVTTSIVQQHQLQVERRERLLGGCDWQSQWREFSQDTGDTPLLYEKCHGIFNDHRESGARLNISSKEQCFYSVLSPSQYWGIRTHTDHRVSTPCWPH